MALTPTETIREQELELARKKQVEEQQRKTIEQQELYALGKQQQKPQPKPPVIEDRQVRKITHPLPYEVGYEIEKEIQQKTLEQGTQIFKEMVQKGEIPEGSVYQGSRMSDRGVSIDYKPPDVLRWELAKPQEKFDILQKEGTIPKEATFKGITKQGEIEYELPPVTKVAITATPALVAKGEEFIYRVAQLMAKRPHLTQQQAELMVQGRIKAEKAGHIEKKPVTDIQYEILDKKSTEQLKQEWKDAGIQAAEMFVPGVSTARNWGTMTAGEKAVSIGIDVGTVLIIIFGPKIIGKGARVIVGKPRIVKLATEAGKAGRELQTKTKLYEKAFTSGKVKPQKLADLADEVQRVQVKSLKADQAFLNKLDTVKQVSSGELKELEKKTGIKGIKNVVDDVGKTIRDVEKAWKRVDKTKVNTTKRIKALDNLADKQKGLEAALNKADSVLKPRYSPKPPPEEFTGFKVSWKKNNPKISQNDMDELQKWLDEELARLKPFTGRGKAAVIERTRPVDVKAKHTLELKPKHGKVKPKPEKAPIKTPRVARERPGIVARDPVPREAYGRMTQAQIEKHYGTQTQFDVRSKTIEEALIDTKGFSKTRPGEWESVRELINAGVESLPSPAEKGLTKQQIKQKVDKAVDEKVSEMTQAKTQLKPVTATMIRTLTKTIIEKGTARKIGKKGGFIIRPDDDTEEKKRKSIKESLGAVTYRRGELNDKDVWHTYHVDKGGVLNRTVVVGPPPEGARVATGKGSTTTTLKLIRGKRLPNFTVIADTGAVDDVITAQGGKLTLSHVPDRISGGGMKRITNGIGRLSPKIPKLR